MALESAEIEAEVPLLPKKETGPWKSAVPGAVFNVSTSIIGAWIMSIPVTLKILGIIPAFILMILIAILVDISVEFMLRFTYSGESSTYAGLMKESFGWAGSVAVQICVIVTNLGCLIMYLIIIGDVLSGKGPEHLGVLQEWFGVYWWNSRPFTLLFIVVFIMIPLVLLRRVESLSFSSAISVFLAFVFVGICSAMAIKAFYQGETKTPKFLPQLDNNGSSFFNLFTAIPVIVTAFTFHFNVHPIGIELGRPADMNKAVKISLLLCAVIYFAIGIFGYLLFGDSTMDDILVNFDRSAGSKLSSLMCDIIRLSYALHLVLVFPILNFSLRTNIDELFFSKKPLLTLDNKRFLVLTLVILISSYALAIIIPSISYIFQFMGSTTAVCLAFIFPGAIAIRDIYGISTRRDKIVAAIMIVLALATSIIAISTNINTLVRNNSF